MKYNNWANCPKCGQCLCHRNWHKIIYKGDKQRVVNSYTCTNKHTFKVKGLLI